MIVYGINPIVEALRAGRVTALRLSERAGERAKRLEKDAARLGIPVVVVDPSALDREARGGVHQGVVASVRPLEPLTVNDLVRGATGAPLLVVLDGIEDPQNLGAILRSADAAGVDGLIHQTRHAARLDGAAAKASAGAFAHVRIAAVVNIARAIDELKALGVWTAGLVTDAPLRYSAIDLTQPIAVVFGAEGSGLRRLVRERCDMLVSIAMKGHVPSLNVSVAAAVVLFEAVRQRAGDAIGSKAL
jgi:23S rRNA (guanosine2251-2'-O)-methyltransferase